MCKSYDKTIYFSFIDSALNCVKQQLQFLRPPPQKIMSPNFSEQSTSGQQQTTGNIDNFDINTDHQFHSDLIENNDLESQYKDKNVSK